jgi:abortive infection bacteriophage resistance protein
MPAAPLQPVFQVECGPWRVVINCRSKFPFKRMSSYNKPSLTLTQQLNILEQTGLKIENRQEASHHLTFINYHRFLGYCKVFQDDNPKYQNKINEIKLFKVDSTFNQVLSLYQ